MRIPYRTNGPEHALTDPVGLASALVTGESCMVLGLSGRHICVVLSLKRNPYRTSDTENSFLVPVGEACMFLDALEKYMMLNDKRGNPWNI